MADNPETNGIKLRSGIDERYKWDLSPMYSDKEEWKRDLEKVKPLMDEIRKYRGSLKKNNKNLAELFRLLDDVERLMEKLFTYAHLKHDENLEDPEKKSMFDTARSMYVKLSEETSFIAPELISLDEERLNEILNDPLLEFARVSLRDIIRRKDHYLSKEEERLLSMAEEVFSVPARVFSMLNDADLKFSPIEDRDGNRIEVTHGRYIGLMMNPDREIRKRAFESMYSSYQDHKNTFCASLEGELKHRVFNARARKYKGALEASLDWDEVDPEVYMNLIRSVRNNLPAMHRYQEVRKRALSLDEVHMWDVYVPLVKDFERKFEFEQAEDIVMKALEPLGQQVLDIAGKAFRNRWIDRYESKGKRSGAYSSGCYDSPPYMLMNYDGGIRDLFTIIHEMGHSVHTYLSNKNQPHITADYRIFVAEVASTVNEVLLQDHLMKEWRSDEERKYLINHQIDGFKGTVFRQTMFAEFERDVTQLVERDEPLTPQLMSEMYGSLNSDYFGPAVTSDPQIRLEWSRIPHFYYNFYVYKYATGFSAANAIASSILEGRSGMVESYLEMLKAGGSKPPLDLLKMAGVDLTVPDPVDRALSRFSQLVEELDHLM